MQIMVTHGVLSRTRVFSVSRAQLAMAITALVVVMLLLSGAVYHFIFLTAAREGWPVVSQLVKLVVRDEFAQRDRFMRENLDAMASRVGEMQARMVRLETMGERVAGLAGVKPDDLKVSRNPATAASGVVGASAPAPSPTAAASAVPSHGAVLGRPAGAGGPFIPANSTPLERLTLSLQGLDESAERTGDLFTIAQSTLFESRLRALMVPNSRPIEAPMGSGFGFRSDPFTGRPALHTGLDFAADIGTPILAAAGGVVLSTDQHPQYGNLLEIDHGNGLTTRYAHVSRFLVKAGELVKRGQPVAHVGNSGRSTGPHLHFEVLVEGVPQNPSKFLAAVPAPGPQAQAPAPVWRP